MFDMFDLFISLHPHILMSLGSCALACILASLYPYVRVYLLASLRPCILTSLCLCVHACIFAFLHPYILRFMCPHLHPCILISSGSYVLASILVSSHPHILRVMYSGCWLVFPDPHIQIFLRSCALGACWYPHTLTSSYPQVPVFVLVWEIEIR